MYLGNGCFWHTQYDFYTVETDSAGPFNRDYKTVTGRVGYAGGKGTGPAGQVCYHGGPAGTEYENMAYAEAVQVMLDEGKESEQFDALVKKYFEDTFHNVNGVWTRGDPGDRGAPYRNVIGIPGGVKGPLYAALVKHNLHSMPLIEGGVSAILFTCTHTRAHESRHRLTVSRDLQCVPRGTAVLPLWSTPLSGLLLFGWRCSLCLSRWWSDTFVWFACVLHHPSHRACGGAGGLAIVTVVGAAP